MPGIVNPVRQVERLRNLAGDSTAVQCMSVPSYISSFLCDSERTQNVILVYKTNSKTSAASLPISFVPEEDSSSTDLDVTGNPLESPFEDDVFEDTVVSIKQCPWIKAELNQFPIPLQAARALINEWNEDISVKDVDGDDTPLLDFWILTQDGTCQDLNVSNGKSSTDGTLLDVSNFDSSSIVVDKSKPFQVATVMLGRHCVEKWYSRSIVKAKCCCSINSPEMNPEVLELRHLHSSKLPASKVKAHVLCRFTVSGHPVAPDPSVNLSLLKSYSCVTLELQWNKLSMSPPLESASTNLISQVAVGHHSSPAYSLWKQLRLLQGLLNVLLASWCGKKAPTELPGEEKESSEDSSQSPQSLENKLELLIREGRGRGFASLTQSGGARKSVAPLDQQSQGLGRRSLAPGRMSIAPKNIKEGDLQPSHVSLLDAVNIVTERTRENTDFTDELWHLLSECRTYDQLSRAWSLVFSELTQGYARPYIRPKNCTRAAKLLQALVSGLHERGPDFYEVEGCGIFEPLELLVELGLEKLSTDFHYIFLHSETVGKDYFVPPKLLRNDITVSRDKWLSSCGHFLGWLAQVHTALEVILPLYQSLCPEKAIANIAPLALKHFQSETSPVRSVSGLLTSIWQEFHCVVNTRDIHNLLTDKFDFLKLTLVSEHEMRRVESVFLRSCSNPLFPSQIFNSGENFSVGAENVMYYCAEALKISDYLG